MRGKKYGKILLTSRGVIRDECAKDMRSISEIKEQIKYYEKNLEILEWIFARVLFSRILMPRR